MGSTCTALARTGSSTWPLVIVALVLLGAGALAVVAARRRMYGPGAAVLLIAVVAVGVAGPASRAEARTAPCPPTTTSAAPSTTTTAAVDEATTASSTTSSTSTSTTTTTAPTTTTEVPADPPSAVDDAYEAFNTDTVSGNVLGNDDLGDPTADISAVGGGGQVGVAQSVGGGLGTFLLAADGTATLTTTNPVLFSSYSTTYTISNAGGSSTATVTLTIFVIT
ncbi:MAG TPA: hypothetical protein VK507_17180 [Iamia sp.]|nr:hypothetical protein [Iamia sp.]